MENISITARDIEIMTMIYGYDKVGLDQLSKRFSMSYERCRQRVRRLTETSYLTTTRIPSWSGVGSGKYLLGLGSKGKRLLAEHLKVSASSLRHLTSTATPYLANHHLAICDFRVSLEVAAAGLGVDIVEWILERELKRQGGYPIPDGRFTIQVGRRKQDFDLELDMGTIPIARIREKLAAYLQLGGPRPVLWVVPSPDRAYSIASTGTELAATTGGDSTRFFISLQRTDPLGHVWKVVGGPDAVSLVGGAM